MPQELSLLTFCNLDHFTKKAMACKARFVTFCEFEESMDLVNALDSSKASEFLRYASKTEDDM